MAINYTSYEFIGSKNTYNREHVYKKSSFKDFIRACCTMNSFTLVIYIMKRNQNVNSVLVFELKIILAHRIRLVQTEENRGHERALCYLSSLYMQYNSYVDAKDSLLS